MDVVDYLDHIRADGNRLAEVTDGAMNLDVPSCPGWTVERLIGHVGKVHRHKDAIVRDRIRSDPPEGPEPPTDGLLDWYRSGLDAMLELFADRDPAEQVFTWYPPDQSVGFWIRRMAHETLIHRVDGELATGREGPVDEDLASDGVDEILGVFMTGVPAWGSFTAGTELIRLEVPDRSWTLRFGRFIGTSPNTGTSYDLEAVEFDDGAPAAVVSGSAQALDLWLWGRAPLDQLDVEGDRTLADRLRTLAAEETQ